MYIQYVSSKTLINYTRISLSSTATLTRIFDSRKGYRRTVIVKAPMQKTREDAFCFPRAKD